MTAENPFKSIHDGRTLAEAIVDTIREPLLILDDDLRVVAASRSFYRAFRVTRQDTQGRMLYELGDGQWNIPALRELLERAVSQHAALESYEVEHEFPGIGRRAMLLNARQVFYEGNHARHLLLAFEDVTDRRAHEREKDELLRQKDVLLQEMEHRVANSLDIIASILLLKAKTVDSPETRHHLEDARRRVLSVAAVQRHLRPGGLGDTIAIGPYLTKLCESLEQSMMSDRRPVSLTVHSADGDASSRDAVSLGLITTELVINGLKHAFADADQGEIVVRYETQGSGWSLAISDNGVGLPDVRGHATRPGLGSTIVEALAGQLDARVEIVSGPEGTTVSIRHAM